MADPSKQLDSLARGRGSAMPPARNHIGGKTVPGPLDGSDGVYATDGARSGQTGPYRKGYSIHSMDHYRGWKPAQPNPHNLRGRM